jgi:hypothetical protein
MANEPSGPCQFCKQDTTKQNYRLRWTCETCRTAFDRGWSAGLEEAVERAQKHNASPALIAELKKP